MYAVLRKKYQSNNTLTENGFGKINFADEKST